MTPAIPLEQRDEVRSTSDELIERATAGAGECALMARRQTGGRGRLGRRWETVDGNLHLSVLLRPQAPVAPGPWSLLAAVAVSDALHTLVPGRLRLKWPNDVLLDGAKVAGILLEAGTDAGPWLVIGLGVNLAGAPAGLGRPTACVADLVSPPPPEAFAVHVLAAVSHWRTRLEREGFGPISQAWLALGPATGDALVVGTGPQRQAGTFRGLGPDGSLLLDGPAGLTVIRSGEVA